MRKLRLANFAIMKLCILGVGSKECKHLEETLRNLLAELGDDAKIHLSDDIDLFLKHKITKTPALLVDDILVHNEQLRNTAFLKSILHQASHHDNYHQDS